jgi:hypothetical protein
MLYGPDPSGCAALQLPAGGFDLQQGDAVRKMVVADGPSTDLLWILTKVGRVYALTSTNSRG